MQDFWSVSDHFGTLCIKGLTIFPSNMFGNFVNTSLRCIKNKVSSVDFFKVLEKQLVNSPKLDFFMQPSPTLFIWYFLSIQVEMQ